MGTEQVGMRVSQGVGTGPGGVIALSSYGGRAVGW